MQLEEMQFHGCLQEKSWAFLLTLHNVGLCHFDMRGPTDVPNVRSLLHQWFISLQDYQILGPRQSKLFESGPSFLQAS